MNDLANILRPKTLEQFIGQDHILCSNSALYQLIVKKEIPHLFFYGAPGTGKTSLAKIIANSVDLHYYQFNATTLKIEQIREVIKKHQNALIKPLMFIDEVHRLSKNQQEVLLPIMENNQAVVIGASTENPFYTLTNAIRSRSFVFEFKPLEKKDLVEIIQKALDILKIDISKEVQEYLLQSSAGDARSLLNLMEFAFKVNPSISLETLQQLRSQSQTDGMNAKDSHYNIASAMIKSLRGSDVDAALYYVARLIEGGERVEFITRRLMIFASEDIGNANPNALNLSVSTHTAVKDIGYPEARIILGQCVIYLASSPKSNAGYLAINKACDDIKNGTILAIPKHIDSIASGYKYPHDFGGYCEQEYLDKELNLYQSKSIGFEKTLDDWLKKIKEL
ncbi:MAG: replication-associated recombination protein A [Campylobacterota bacterium]|nr:replication-associated recombination protein A [Campylobacterota bacterium]